jgi:hypothetical protein
MWDRGLRTASASVLDINSVWQRPRRLSSTATVPQKLLNIFVKVDHGEYTKFQGATLATDRTDFLAALRADAAFFNHLKDVSLDMCTIAIVSTTSEEPTPSEEADATLLRPRDTVSSAMTKASIDDGVAFLHVRTSKAAANTSG